MTQSCKEKEEDIFQFKLENKYSPLSLRLRVFAPLRLIFY